MMKIRVDKTMSKVLNYEIDDLTYLTIDYIVMENGLCSGRNLKTNNVIKWLFDKALKEYIVENNDIILKRHNHELSMIEDKLKGEEITLESIFPNIAKEKE